jgi:spore coat protein SA
MSRMGHVTIIRVAGGNKRVYLSNVLKAVKGLHYDVIQIDNRPGFVSAVRAVFPNTRLSVFLHSTTFISPPKTSIKKADKDFAGADLIIGNSRSLQAHLLKTFPRHSHKVRFVHLGVNVQQFRPLNPIRSSRGKQDPFVILYAGRLIPLKGIPVLIKAAKIVRKTIPNAKLSIAGGVGKPSYKKYLKRLAASLRVPAVFKGNVSRSRMPSFYLSGDCFVCPSQGHEAFGLVNVEAMASGVPAVASRIGGIPEIIQHQHNGLLVANYSSPSAFARQIIRIAENPALANKLANRARQDVIRKFSWNATAGKLVGIYRSV